MNKFWINEKTIVFSSIILLLLFLGLISLMGYWMGALLPETELVSCYPGDCFEPELEMDEEELKNRIIYLNEALIDLPSAPTENECTLTAYDIQIEKGRIYAELNDYQKAEESFLKALLEHEDDFIYALLADNEWRFGHYRQAKKYLWKAIDYKSTEYDHWDKLIYLEKNYFSNNFRELNHLYALAAETAGTERAYSSYAFFLEDQERYEEAAQVWRDFLRVDPSQEDRYRPRVEWLESKT